MKIAFEMTMDDYVAFNRCHFIRSKSARRMRAVTMAVVAALAIGGSLVIEPAPDRSRAELVLFAVLFSVIFAILFRFVYPRTIERQVRRLLAEGKNKGIFGRHVLEIDDEGIVERTDLQESRYTWHAVENVIETNDYAFIYTSSVGALVIPKLTVIEGDADPFIEQVKALWQRQDCDN